MNFNQTLITIKKLNALCLEAQISECLETQLTECLEPEGLEADPTSEPLINTVCAEMIALGFTLSKDLYVALASLSKDKLSATLDELFEALNYLKGADVEYQPMYPGFPQQVIDSENGELYFNALLHYWTFGEWLPEFEPIKRPKSPESYKLHEIGLASESDLLDLFPRLLSSADSLSEEDKAIVSWFINQESLCDKLVYPDDIPFAETRCVVAAELLTKGLPIEHLVKTATDILRLATFMSGGDVSLATNTKFKSFSRSTRKTLVLELERVIKEEDIGRHRNKWVRLFHALHVGDYSKSVFAIASKARNNEKLAGFYSELERAIGEEDVATCCKLLQSRPGEFGRRLDQILRLAEKSKQQVSVSQQFLSVVDDINTRNVLQLLGHLKTRGNNSSNTVVFPKGSTQKAVIVERDRAALESNVLAFLLEGIRKSLSQRFAKLPMLGKVWLDPELMDCPIPSQQRSATTALRNVARGTRLPMGDKGTLRFFIYWQGQDIDLSATFHDEDYTMIEQVSYTHLKSSGYEAYHSGDITRAPKGACEFIDIAINTASNKARYVAMNVLVFSGPTFAEHSICYAGWMTREKPRSNEVFEPASVKQKIDVRATCRNIIPVVFDLQERRAIWVDLATSSNAFHYANNVESNRASIEEKLKAIVESRNKLSLYELFELHAMARGELVTDKEEAETIFGLNEGIGPYDINAINADYIG